MRKYIWFLSLAILLLLSCSHVQKEKQDIPSSGQPSDFHGDFPYSSYGLQDNVNPLSDGEAQREHPVSEDEKNYHAKRGVSTLEDAYIEGYDDGYEDGEEDGSKGRDYGISFDPDSDFTGKFASSYENGYQDGYHDGYYSHFKEIEDDEDEDGE